MSEAKPLICRECAKPAEHTYTGLCRACLLHHFDDDLDDDFDPEGPAFECAGYNDGTGFYCPLWGTEECDWDCTEGMRP